MRFGRGTWYDWCMKIRRLLFSICFCAFLISFGTVHSEILQPYVVDSKSQVLFGDSVDLTSHYGLENYTKDYVGGFIHITYTYTHSSCCVAGYPPEIYVTEVDPTTTSSWVQRSLTVPYLLGSPNSDPQDWYSYDIQFDSTGYTTVVKQEGVTETYNQHRTITGLLDTDFVSLANQYPSSPLTTYSMAFGVGAVYVAPTAPPAGNSSVLFLPGIESSRLYRGGRPDEGGGEKKLWEPTSNQNIRDLFLDDSGKPLTPLLPEYAVYTRDVLEEAYLSNSGPNIYKSFLLQLDSMKNTDHAISDYSAVPYDWRLSLDDILNGGAKTSDGKIYYEDSVTEPYILSELTRLASSSQNGKVTIVAHSNGGLVAKALLQRLADTHNPLLDKVDKLIMVAVPQLGTPMAVAANLHGYDQGIPLDAVPLFLSDSVAREFAENSPATYNLLPSANYFAYVDTPVVRFDTSLPLWISRYGAVVNSQSSQHNFLTDTYGRVSSGSSDVNNPDNLHDLLLLNAEAVHAVLDNWTPPSSMQVIDIAGWGVPTTMSGLVYKRSSCFSAVCSASVYNSVKPYPTWTIDGDGIVAAPSALWTNGNASTTRYWVDLERYNNAYSDLGHKDVLEVPQLLNLIETVVTSTSTISIPQYIYTSVPTTNSTATRLIYGLHSPLTLDIYDNLGHHTGISTTTGQIEEQISGTYFVQFGDAKYIFTNTDNPSYIVMSGYDTGTFTFNIDEVQGDSTIYTLTFQDIPTTPNTRVTINISGGVSTASALLVDSNGDGAIDINLTPVVNGTVTYTPPGPGGVSLGGNGPIVQSLMATSSTNTLVATTSVQLIGTTTPIATTTPSTSIQFGSKNTKAATALALKSKVGVKQRSIDTFSNLNQSAQVVSANQKYLSRLGDLLKLMANKVVAIFR